MDLGAAPAREVPTPHVNTVGTTTINLQTLFGQHFKGIQEVIFLDTQQLFPMQTTVEEVEDEEELQEYEEFLNRKTLPEYEEFLEWKEWREWKEYRNIQTDIVGLLFQIWKRSPTRRW